MVRQFKTFSARRINQQRGTPGVPVWQRNYYERIIRNDEELNGLREYINNNPMNWETDDEFRIQVGATTGRPYGF
jgi:putative transposase